MSELTEKEKWLNLNQKQEQIISDLKQQLAEMTSSRDFYKDENQSFGNVLAVIHCDGGHYITEHGHKKASQDAIKKWHKLNQLIAESKEEIARLKEELRYALDFDPDGMVSKIKGLEAEIARLKTYDKILLEIISGIRPHFEKTGLSCLDDCDEAIDILRKRNNL